MSDTTLEITERLRVAVTKFLVPLQTTRKVESTAFDELAESIKAISVVLKQQDLVPKGLLHEIYRSIRVIENEAVNMKQEEATLRKMANQLDVYFGMILGGESHEDRAPGIPRVV